MKNRHHFYHTGSSFNYKEAKQLKNHPLSVAYLDTDVHAEYHARHRGLSETPHSLVISHILDSLEVIKVEQPSPEHVAEYTAYHLGTLALMDSRIGVRRSADRVQQLLINQIPFLIEGHASYER